MPLVHQWVHRSARPLPSQSSSCLYRSQLAQPQRPVVMDFNTPAVISLATLRFTSLTAMSYAIPRTRPIAQPQERTRVRKLGSSAKSTEKPTGKPATSRLVKITTTRPLASPGHLQPCPIYTIDGRVQKNSGYSTTISR